MTTYGYARTSMVDQSIYQERISSVKMEDRVEFARVRSILKTDDVLVFSSLSRAARSMVHMVDIEARVSRAGATIRILDLAVDTATPEGRLTFNLFASIAQFERGNMLERQRVGLQLPNSGQLILAGCRPRRPSGRRS